MIINSTPLLGSATYPLSKVVRAFQGPASHTMLAPTVLIEHIVRTYFDLCAVAQVNAQVALCQMIHETGWLSSRASQPPFCNPAGIGITGPNVAGVTFETWALSIPAHVGRILAYALTPSQENTGPRQELIRIALNYRALPESVRGAASTVGLFASIWAADPNYVAGLARVATAIETA